MIFRPRALRRGAGVAGAQAACCPIEPVVEIADILGQDLFQMALIEYEHVVEALGPDRSHPALGDRVGPRRSEWRARLGNTEIAHPPVEAGGPGGRSAQSAQAETDRSTTHE